jgi:hypothetical protein
MKHGLCFCVLWAAAVAVVLWASLFGAERVNLTISIELDPRVYDYTDYGEPPQLAVWLEQPGSGKIRTLFVTYRTAKGEWHGKIECPVSLPYWLSRYRKESGTTGLPGPKNPVPDAVSGATPKKEFTVKTVLPEGSRWNYYIEVNASGDYNRRFPSVSDNGMPDSQGNGQPSLIYTGEIEAVPGQRSTPLLAGRTKQLNRVDKIIKNLEGITSAKGLLTKITVRVF